MNIGNIRTDLYHQKGWLWKERREVRVLGAKVDEDEQVTGYIVRDLFPSMGDRQWEVHSVELYPVLDELPEGWRWLDGATTAPNGYKWAAHGSLFWRTNGKERYEHAIIPVRR